MMSWTSVSFTDDGNYWPPPCNWLCSLVSFACHQPLASSLSFPILIGIKFLANIIVDIFIIVIKIIALIIIIIATSRWLDCPAFLLFSTTKNLTNAKKKTSQMPEKDLMAEKRRKLRMTSETQGISWMKITLNLDMRIITEKYRTTMHKWWWGDKQRWKRTPKETWNRIKDTRRNRRSRLWSVLQWRPAIPRKSQRKARCHCFLIIYHHDHN